MPNKTGDLRSSSCRIVHSGACARHRRRSFWHFLCFVNAKRSMKIPAGLEKSSLITDATVTSAKGLLASRREPKQWRQNVAADLTHFPASRQSVRPTYLSRRWSLTKSVCNSNARNGPWKGWVGVNDVSQLPSSVSKGDAPSLCIMICCSICPQWTLFLTTLNLE